MKSSQITSFSEKTLIKAAQHGDLEAFNLLILRYQNLLFGIALRLLTDEDVAADAVQEALISAFRRFNTFRGDSLRSWLARVVVNACYDEMRKKRRQHSVPLELFNAEGEEIETSYWLVDPQADPELQYESSELETAIHESLDKLPPIYRLMLVLVDVEGLSYEEAASAAGIPVGTVKSRLARARLQMQRSLQMAGELLPSSYQIELPLSM
ncbi:MAG TPA: sigma-70 family RNA polymerase sigma factor [Anaerolineales bacterium]|nr:sigma-70 family RNA polymerase sigma factor [Anaerolineales bacterium]